MSKLYTCSNRGEKQEIIDFIKEGKYPDDLNKDQKGLLEERPATLNFWVMIYVLKERIVFLR